MPIRPIMGTEIGFPSGPVADRLTVWPMDDGRYGVDATFEGTTGYERAASYERELQATTANWSFRQELGGAWTLRFGPLSGREAAAAFSAFVH